MSSYNKLFIVLCLFCVNSLFAQEDTIPFYNKTLKKNNLSFELGGKGQIYSIGYERTFYKTKFLLFSSSINLFYFPFTDYYDKIYVPIGINSLIGKKKNKLLIGLYETNGFDFTPYPKTRKERKDFKNTNEYKYNHDTYQPFYSFLWVTPSIGYRRYFKKGNSLSITLNYFFIHYNDSDRLYFQGFEYNKIEFPWLGINYNIKLFKC